MTRTVNLIRNLFSDKNFQENQNINMQLVKPPMDMWLPKPAVQYKYQRLCRDKNCQSTRCYKKYEDTKCDKNCQAMSPKMPINNMQSVTKFSKM